MFLDGRAVDPESRVDRYLALPGCESVGVKLRGTNDPTGGKLEIKALVGGVQVTRFRPNVVGRTDAWVKWTHPTQVDQIISAEPSWVAVKKRRSLRTFSLDENVCAEVGADLLPRPRGMNVLVEGGVLPLLSVLCVISRRGPAWFAEPWASGGSAMWLAAVFLRMEAVAKRRSDRMPALAASATAFRRIRRKAVVKPPSRRVDLRVSVRSDGKLPVTPKFPQHHRQTTLATIQAFGGACVFKGPRPGQRRPSAAAPAPT